MCIINVVLINKKIYRNIFLLYYFTFFLKTAVVIERPNKLKISIYFDFEFDFKPT